MWEKFLGRFPSNLIIFLTFLSVALPWATYKINQKLHQYGDPPWKKDSKRD
ncbi:hypothetical protein [Aquibacillus albus]|uniref:Uncharacterized protein n=1 Tax=Aquibacillus albus TaxID=1168171 RepID=A0ABS2MYT3_9BACI|nr:hypothetical protein [Aquibacillus albus]MBM7571030.1 hypothetical protein [Aquibacillus albus]